jgi:LPXTG-motif cell wall-anchored protein
MSTYNESSGSSSFNWSGLVVGLMALGGSLLSLIKPKQTGPSQDSVSNAYVQGGFAYGTSPTAVMGVNPLLWVGVALLAVFLLFGRRRK